MMCESVFVLQEYGDDGESDWLIAAYRSEAAAEAGKAAYLAKHPVLLSGRFAGQPPEIGVVEVPVAPEPFDASNPEHMARLRAWEERAGYDSRGERS